MLFPQLSPSRRCVHKEQPLFSRIRQNEKDLELAAYQLCQTSLQGLFSLTSGRDGREESPRSEPKRQSGEQTRRMEQSETMKRKDKRASNGQIDETRESNEEHSDETTK